MFKSKIVANNFYMKNLKFSKIIDFVFINFIVFLITFAWIRFLIKKIILALILSAIILLIFNFIKYFFNKSKEDKFKISKTLEQDIESYNLTLISNETGENLKFFANMLIDKSPKIIEEQNLVLYKENCSGIIEDFALAPIYCEPELQYSMALKHISFAIKNKAKCVYLCCNACSQKTKLLLEKIDNIQVVILDKNLVYSNFFKVYNTYPDIKFKFKIDKKIKLKEIINISFDKSRTKSYFLSGLFIFFCSFFVKYNFYYVFMSSLLFLFALLSKTKGKNKALSQ